MSTSEGTIRNQTEPAHLLELRRTRYGYTINVYIHGAYMRVAKWGNSLAVRLPAAIVEALGLKDGDDIQIEVAGRRRFEIKKDRSRERAIESLRKLSRKFPEGFVFNREEANAR